MKQQDVIKADRFYFLRHGESVNNRDNLVNGWTDCPLTDKGRKQARKAALLLQNEPINRIVTSDLIRAVETAEIIAKVLNLPVERYSGLRERNWGIYENGPRSERPELNETPEEGESSYQYFFRVVETLADVTIANDNLFVGHAGTARVMGELLSVEQNERRIQNCSPILVSIGQRKWHIRFLSNIDSYE